ncbi:putative primosomal protein N' [Glutamicibacter uratoxydans]|uniref:Probable replication restart protein PriA n=1 Tax=Glutamicibacter uratoxydans TaxID=43667 RepID=A0A4Y4DM39_GLUUR|nr:primosomal protein PriA [Glutamicibacter uratoxydans]GED04680.1 putative primosomal protein N' [Glutamicibacter uratoxydans]
MQQDALISAPEPARLKRVARVLIDSSVPHLDRLFDYEVPASMMDDAAVGVRVKVPFGAQQLAGFIIELLDDYLPSRKLRPLGKVVSSQVVLHPPVYRAAELVAARYAGTIWDVVRLAVPTRAAKVEKEELDTVPPVLPEAPNQLSHYEHGEQVLADWAEGRVHRAVASWVPNYYESWPGFISDAARPVLERGAGVLVLVPDARDLNRLCAHLDETFGAGSYARLHAEDGPTPRYRNFLRAIGGHVQLVVGTRSAALCQVPNLELMIIWQDADQSHREQRAPYQHSREVALLRSSSEDFSVLLAAPSRSVEAQRLVATGWATELKLQRSALRAHTPRVAATTNDFELQRDPLLARARIPSLAWKEASAALETGPVLVQVARTGFMPALACQDCRSLARCGICQGPLQLSGAQAVIGCKWCGEQFHNYRCMNCGSPRIRAASIGAERTAEELGQAFSKVPVLWSTGAKPIDEIPAKPALVVATPGVEPAVGGGYAAVLLLDADRMLAHDSLRNTEQTLARWFNAAAMASSSGVVVLTGNPSAAGAALVRWDPAGFAERELADRREIGLPPAVRSAVISGAGAERLIAALDPAIRNLLQIHGPTIIDGPPLEHRYVLFFSYSDGAQVTDALRGARAQMSAAKEPVVNIAVDPDQVL